MQAEAVRRVLVYDAETAQLLAAGEEAALPGHTHAFSCIRGNGALLLFYFVKGRRDVLVRLGPNEGVTAQLGTRWRGGRREWTLDW